MTKFLCFSTVSWSNTSTVWFLWILLSAHGSAVGGKQAGSKGKESGGALMAQSCVEAIVKACSWELSSRVGGEPSYLPPGLR